MITKLFGIAVVGAALSLGGCGDFPFKPIEQITVRYEGETDLDMLQQVRKDIKSAQDLGVKKLVVYLDSPGGSAIMGPEIARRFREASDKGLIVEMHADLFCASACTLVLASGTPGYRFIQKDTIFLVHPMQVGGMFSGPQCVDHVNDVSTVEGKMTYILLENFRDGYVKYTGQPYKTVVEWTTCGQERVGKAAMAVDMKIADKVE